MWIGCTAELGLRPALVTPMRHPTEVLASVRTTDRDRHTDATKLGWWLNMMLHTEEQTREARRSYILYDDLLTDWRSALAAAEQALGVDLVAAAGDDAAKQVDELVDPSLRRAVRGWDDIDASADLRDLAEAAWKEFAGAATAGGDTVERRATFDELRASYVRLYGAAEALAESSLNATARAARESAEAAAESAAAATRSTPARRWGVPRVRRAAGRVARWISRSE